LIRPTCQSRCRRRATVARALALARIMTASLFGIPAAIAQQDPHEDEIEEITVQSTRSGRRVQDEPLHVEVIVREEIEEKLLMTPGNIAMLVSETGGVRVQVTSPALGASNVRMQGMAGRYTQLLADGLPLYGGQASSLGLLQVPPTDLGQVEVIKGAASALYGPSALGGLVNLISRRPSAEPLVELLANATSRGGRDVTGYGSTRLSGDWSASLTGGIHRQARQDLDADGWIDMPGYERASLRPRFHWEGDGGATALLTLGAMTEERRGGTGEGRTTPDGLPFPMRQDTRRFDAGAVVVLPVGDAGRLQARASAVTQDHDHRFGALLEQDRHDTLFAEATLSTTRGNAALLGGIAFQQDRYASTTFPGFHYVFTVPGLFAQVEQTLADDLTLAASLRGDHHSEYGARVSPRVSMLYRSGPWTVRASFGQGFYAPTPFVEETEAAGLARLAPLRGLRAESARTASVEAGRLIGSLEASLVLFASQVDGAVQLDPAMPGDGYGVRLVNSPGATRSRGAEVLLRYRVDDFTVTGSYVHVDATEPDLLGGRRAVPITPRHTAGLVGLWERHGSGRLGLELYYTGEQALEDNPYRATGRPYLELGLLGEINVGTASLFLNLENILGVRQTRRDPMLLRSRAPDGRWTVDAWQPTDGFVVNGGVRLRFGG
jgi:outer membrane receptor for ferrienterochelin and colicins